MVSERDRVADLERLVENDGKRREQIAEHALGCERHGDTADAETGDQGGDVEAQVLEHQQQRQRPHRDPNEELDQRQRVAHRGLVRPGREPPGK